jgi:hypothetical protein
VLENLTLENMSLATEDDALTSVLVVKERSYGLNIVDLMGKFSGLMSARCFRMGGKRDTIAMASRGLAAPMRCELKLRPPGKI